MAPPIAQQLGAARAEEARIRTAVSDADLPFQDVTTETDALVQAMESIAIRAERVYDYLASHDPRPVQARLSQLESEGSEGDLAKALREQLAAYEKLSTQLQRFYEEMEHITASLSTVGAQVVSMSAASDGESGQRELAEPQVRDLRDQVNALSDGMRGLVRSPTRRERRGQAGSSLSCQQTESGVAKKDLTPGVVGFACRSRSSSSSSARPSSAPRSPPPGCSRRTSARRRSCGRTRSRSCSSRSASATGSAAGSPTASRTCAGSARGARRRGAARRSFRSSRGPFLVVSVDALDAISAGAFLGSLVGVLVLVAVPVLLLGAVSP